MQSIYSPGKDISVAQWAAEIMCERRAKSLNLELPDKFWKLPEWKNFYLFQISNINKLIKLYSEEAIISAIKDPDLQWVYSFKTKKINSYIKSYKKKKQLEKTKPKRITDHVGKQKKQSSFLDNIE